MSIPKLTSQGLNEILKASNAKVDAVNSRIDNIKSDISQKLTVIKYETDYANSMMAELQSGMFTKDANMSLLTKAYNGGFEKYGSTIHSQFVKEPINVFNLKVSGTGEVFFRNDVSMSVNGNTTDRYTSV
jgi:hypothetical protein